MDHLEVLGRHALLFDDDTTAAFVNSSDALVEWNSLLIDRYDVRHLLQHPPPPLKKRRHQPSPSSPPSLESELDRERYLDLPPESFDEQDQSSPPESNGELAVGGAYQAVAFSYGNPDDSTDHKNLFEYSGFLPPFPVPESLLQNLPPTEKIHQIIARTALFVSKHGGQSEIVLRVKQGDNPTFGFLMPDHHLHVYFRFLVDHPEIMKSNTDDKPREKKDNNQKKLIGDFEGGALSLLGSVYGFGEDEDVAPQIACKPNEKEVGEPLYSSNGTFSLGSEGAESGKDGVAFMHSHPAAKEKVSFSKRIRPVTSVTASSTGSQKRDPDSLGAPMEKPQVSSLANNSKVEPIILEPPSHIKTVMDKIVEFILKNGKEFEAVLIEQDSKNGRFPFLLSSNQYHYYYLKLLQKAQELPGKSFTAQKRESLGQAGGKRTAFSKECDTSQKGSSSHDIPYDSEKKGKFKMVLGGSKKDSQDLQAKPAQQQCGASLDAVAAILSAATRGPRNTKLDTLPKSSMGDFDLTVRSEGGPTSSFGSLSSSRALSSTTKPSSNGPHTIPVPVELSTSIGQSGKEATKSDVSVAKAIAKTAAIAAASEADSSEAGLTKEQMQKAERLKRAKMFAAMIKGGVVPRTNELLPRVSAEPPDSSGYNGSTCEGSARDPDASNQTGSGFDLVGREREGSSVPVDVNTSNKLDISEKKSDDDDDYKEKKSRKKYRSRVRNLDDEDEIEGEHKQSRKRHHSHHSSHHSRDKKHKHRERNSSLKDKESHRRRRKHFSSSEDEYHQHRSRSDKYKRSHSEREVEIEEGEIITTLSSHSDTVMVDDGASREASLDLSNSRREGLALSVADAPPTNTTEVPDELRAKVRAMLRATL